MGAASESRCDLGGPAMTVIDVWAQLPGPSMTGQSWMEPLLRWTGRPETMLTATVEETIAEMDAAGVDMALLSAWHAPTGWLITNDDVAAAVDRAPDRFRGLASVDLSDPMGAVRTIRQLAHDDRFVGLRVVPWLVGLPPDDRRYYPVYVACVDAGMPLCTQIGHTGPLRSSETGRPIPYLEHVLLDFPDLVVVGGHVGFPWLDEVASLTVKFPNLYVDTSAYALDRLPGAFLSYMSGVGRSRVMFGTNWPMISHTRALRSLDELGLAPEDRQAFLSGTASRIFGLSPHRTSDQSAADRGPATRDAAHRG
jgi:predicted TIM-barrel fold metal-dependent hydrolase